MWGEGMVNKLHAAIKLFCRKDRNDNSEFVLVCQYAQFVAHLYLLDYFWMIPPPIMSNFQLKIYSQT